MGSKQKSELFMQDTLKQSDWTRLKQHRQDYCRRSRQEITNKDSEDNALGTLKNDNAIYLLEKEEIKR